MEEEFNLTGISDSKVVRANIKRRAVVTAEQEKNIRDNPSNLTKEGVIYKLNLWRKSRNIYVQKFYEKMLMECKVFAESGKTSDGLLILSRDENGKPKWTERPEVVDITIPKDLKK